MQIILPAARLISGCTPRFRNSHGFAHAQKLAGQVHVDDFLPLGQRHISKSRIDLNAGISHQNVQGAEVLDGLAEHGLHLVFLAHVGLQGEGFAAGGGNVGHHGVGARGIADVVDDHRSAAGGQGFGHGQADARAGSGNQSNLVGEALGRN